MSNGPTLTAGRPTVGQVGDLVFTGAITPHDLETGKLSVSTDDVGPTAKSLRYGSMFLDVPGDRALAQAWQVYANLAMVLDQLGLDASRLARQRVFVREPRDIPIIERVMGHFIDPSSVATSIVQVHGKGVDPLISVQIDAVAVGEGASPPQPKTEPGLEPILGDYPAGVVAGNFFFVSAIPGINPDTNRLGEDPSELGRAIDLFDLSPYRSPRQLAILTQTWFVFDHMKRVCRSVGADLGDILKVMGWLDFPMRDFDPMRPVREHHFSAQQDKVASAALWVGANHTPGALLAYDAVCLIDGEPKQVNVEASQIVSYYVGATSGGGAVFSCGEVPIDEARQTVVAGTGDLEGSVRLAHFGFLDAPTGIEERVAFTFQKLQGHLAAYGASLDDVEHQTVFLDDMGLTSHFERVARDVYDGKMPATTTIPIHETSPFYEDARLEIEVVAPI